MATQLENNLIDIINELETKLVPENIKSGVEIFNVTGEAEILVAQTKIVSPSTNQQKITPDEGYNGISEITVEGVTSSIDSNIQPENIKERCTNIRYSWNS